MMRCVLMVASGGVRMMRSLFMGPCLVVLRGLVVVARCFFVVLRSMPVMVGGFLGHDGS
jgi:hypothetical protein